MVSAKIELNSGSVITIEGSPDEIQKVIDAVENKSKTNKDTTNRGSRKKKKC